MRRCGLLLRRLWLGLLQRTLLLRLSSSWLLLRCRLLGRGSWLLLRCRLLRRCSRSGSLLSRGRWLRLLRCRLTRSLLLSGSRLLLLRCSGLRLLCSWLRRSLLSLLLCSAFFGLLASSLLLGLNIWNLFQVQVRALWPEGFGSE